jgi:long-chain acyl-CoA synthetase
MASTGVNVDLVSIGLTSAIVVLAAYIASSNRQPDIHPAHLRLQSDVSRTRNPGESAIIRNKLSPHGTALHTTPQKDVKTDGDIFWSSVKKYPNKPLFGYRVGESPYVWKVGDAFKG